MYIFEILAHTTKYIKSYSVGGVYMNTTLTSVPIKRFYPMIRRMLRSQLTGYAEWRLLKNV